MPEITELPPRAVPASPSRDVPAKSPYIPQKLATTSPTEELTACPLCASTRLKLFCRGIDRLHRLEETVFRYSVCRDCELLFQSTRPVESEIFRFYPQDYGPYRGRRTAVAPVSSLGWSEPFKRMLRPLWAAIGQPLTANDRRQYEAFYHAARPEMSLLDFGCGSDKFLNQAREAGWRTTGVDFSVDAVQQARDSGHRALVVSDEMWRELAGERFDFIRMNHVVEHLYHPVQVLESLKAVMNDNAVLHIAVPNPKSLSARVFKSCWFSLDCPRHIMLYTPERLIRLLSEVGFRRFNVLHETATKDMARSLGYTLNAMGLIQHGTVDDLRRNRLLSLAAYLPGRLAAAAGCGDRFHVFATNTT